MEFYAVAVGRQIGVFETADEYEKQIRGFSGSKARKFTNRSDALKFVEENKKSDAVKPRDTASALTGGPKNYNYEPLAGTRRMPAVDAGQDRFRTPSLPASKNRSKQASSSLPLSVAAKEGTKASDPTKNSNYEAPGPMRKIPKFCGEEPKPPALQRPMTNDPPRAVSRTLGFLQPAQPTDDAVSEKKHDTTQQPPSNAKAVGYGVYWDDAHPDNVASPVDGAADTLRGSLQAAVHAIRTALRRGHVKLVIYTDDQELLRCVANRMKRWKERQWKREDGLPIPHVDLLQQLDELRQQIDVKFDVPENSRLGPQGQRLADRLATEGAERYPVNGRNS